MSSKPLIIYGTGKTSTVISSYINKSSTREIAAYILDSQFITSEQFLEKPVVDFSQINELYPPAEFEVIVAVGYHSMNDERTRIYNEFKSKGYSMGRYIHPTVCYFSDEQIAEGCVILDHVSIQPDAKVKENTFIWSNSVVAHGSLVNANCWIAAGTTIAGDASVGNNCFLGVNCTIGHNVTLGEATFVGANTLVAKQTNKGAVVISSEGETIRLDSQRFMKFSKL